MAYLGYYDLKEATIIRDDLGKDKAKHWGFVIVRCTYSSQEKWDKFLALAKTDVAEYFEWRPVENVHASMIWTVIEDEALEGASLGKSSRRFKEWVELEGRKELQGGTFRPGFYHIQNFSPRYCYYLHVEQESLESVVDKNKARLGNGYFCTMVEADYLLAREEEREERMIQRGRIAQGQYLNTDSEREEEGEMDEDYFSSDDEEEEETAGDVRKRVEVYELVSLYSILLSGGWYHLDYDFQDELYYVF